MAPRSSTSSSGGGIDIVTLLITAVASAVAAYVCSKVWAPGTLASAAFTPVLVAIVKEALAKPAQVVTQVVPVRGVVRSAQPHDPYEPGAAPEPTMVAPPAPAEGPPPMERVPQHGAVSYHSSGPSTSARRWRLAIITGLLGFLIAAVVFTVPELVAGNSAAGGDRSTTLFGGQKQNSTAPTETTTVPGRTVTVPPPTTVTVPVPAQTTPQAPAVTIPPATTAPAPATTTPTPSPSTTVPVPPDVQP